MKKFIFTILMTFIFQNHCQEVELGSNNEFLNRENENKNSYLDFAKIFLEDKKEVPEEILEPEISRLEKEFAKNRDYEEREKKFLDKNLHDLARGYKMEVLQEEIKKIQNKAKDLDQKEKDEDLRKITIFHQEIQKIKNQKMES